MWINWAMMEIKVRRNFSGQVLIDRLGAVCSTVDLSVKNVCVS